MKKKKGQRDKGTKGQSPKRTPAKTPEKKGQRGKGAKGQSPKKTPAKTPEKKGQRGKGAKGQSRKKTPAKSRSRAKPPGEQALRLEWVEAGSLDDNPANWRSHPDEQVSALREVLADPEIGWAGALLYNERTKRLIDGHARKEIVDPKQRVPVLVGSWTEDAERKILATLDPIAAMADANAERLGELVNSIRFSTPGLQALLDGIGDLTGVELNPDTGGREYDVSVAGEVEMAQCPKCGHKFPL